MVDGDAQSQDVDGAAVPAAGPHGMDLDAIDVTDIADEVASDAASGDSQEDIICTGCGYAVSGGGRACPKCGRALKRPEALPEVSEEDIDVSDLAEEGAPQVWDADYPDASASGLSGVDDTGRSGGFRLLEGNLPLNVFAGLVSGILAFFFALALALLTCSQPGMQPFLPHVIAMSLVATAVGGVLFSLMSRIPFALAGPETVLAAALFLFVGSIYRSMAGLYPTDAMLPTILAAIVLASLSIGALLWLLGKLGAAEYVRFIPIQIIGGVVGGVGVFVLLGTFDWMGQFSLDWNNLFAAVRDCVQLFRPDQCLYSMGPSVAFGVILLIGLARFKNSLFMLAMVLAASAVGYAAGLWGGDLPISTLAITIPNLGDNIFPLPVEALRPGFGAIEWGVIKDNGLYIGGLAVLAVLTSMYRITNLELIHGRESDLNQEYRSLGLTNIVAGLCGGVPSSISYGRSAGNRAVGARGPVAGIVAGLLCAAGLYYADRIIPMIPRFVPEGILIYAGLDLIRDWLFRTRTAFTRRDDVLMLWVTFLTTLLLGLLAGIGVGVGLALMATVSRYSKGGAIRNVLSGVNHRSNVDRAPAQQRTLKEYGDHIHILRLQGFLFLGSMERLLKVIRDRLDTRDMLPVEYLVIDFKLVTGLASAAGIGFKKLRNLVEEYDLEMIITSAPLELEEHLSGMGYVGEDDSPFKVFFNLDFALEWCENRVLDSENMLTMKLLTLPELLAPVFPEPRYIPALMKVLKRVVADKGEAVFRQGDKSDSMYFVESGRLDVELELEGGKLLRLKKVGPGAVFGEMGIYTLAPRSATVRAAEKCVLYMMTIDKLNAVEKRAPVLVTAINRFLINMLSERLVDANKKVRDLMV
ncbi:cyclic nucleotide-binding protein [Pseudodesulfovibrio aespoeensis Aspo-2]|uniref:Cyclic nucleotide-binding protein n=1 Tax=Pseudodesulfovibrio aespoeensis (strain ATCC 700646 / DSM 10631 / Aspo-2) TaxID=643562 RepID=E6VUT9_PSEA9|nr:cyclic nucleotide-binding protein [Pseudodesulfovibrio aespoeensis Aspo-2]